MAREKNQGALVRNRQKEARQADILSSAIAVIARRGYHRTRISDIAQEAGVAYGLVYHYFGSKENILVSIFENIWERFGHRIERISASKKTTVEKLTEISDYMLDTCIARPDLIRLLVQEVVRGNNIENFPEMEIVKKIIGMIENIFRRGIESGELRKESDPRLLSFAFFGSMETVLFALTMDMYGKEMNSRRIKQLKAKLRIFIEGGSFGNNPG